MSFVYTFQILNYPFCIQIFLQNFEKDEKNVVISKTTSSHCTLMTDSVQWLSQSDYRHLH